MKEVTYTKSSEWVSPAHPDRAADCIASEIINKIYSLDGKNAHAAIEVAIFDNKVIVGGEAKTTLDLSPEALKPIVQHVLREVGYNLALREKFSKEDVYIDSDYEVLSFVNKQSPDIAKGTTDLINGEPGFNDQGTYCGFASNKTKNRLSYEHYLATSLGEFLYRKAKQTDFLGVDIKVLVQVKYSMDNDKFIGVQGITVACPTVRYSDKCKEYWKSEKDFDDFCLATIRSYCADWFFMNFNYELDMDKLLINGTGVYHSHGPKADSALSGRKLVVNQCGNFAAGGSMIKPILASDRLLNIYARHIAKVAVDAGLGNEVTVELSASIGQTKIGSLRLIGIEKHYDIIYNYFMGKPFSPNYLNEKWRTLQRNNFNKVVFMNFFGSDRYDVEPWEDTEEDVKELQRLIWDAEHNWK